MPIVSVHRQGASTRYIESGTQYIQDQLIIPSSGTATVYLSSDVYTTPGYYVLFDYSESTNGTPVSGSLSNLAVDVSDLDSNIFSGSYNLTNNTADKKIILMLQGNLNSGTQYIESGTLTISSPMTIYLSKIIHNTPGEYVLFDWSSSGSFVGDISNISIVTPPGRLVDVGVSSNGCRIVGNTITVTLV